MYCIVEYISGILRDIYVGDAFEYPKEIIDFEYSFLEGINSEGKRRICRIKTDKKTSKYFLLKNTMEFFSIFHKCNSMWSYNIPGDNNEYCFKCKIKTPQHIIIQQRLLNGK